MTISASLADKTLPIRALSQLKETFSSQEDIFPFIVGARKEDRARGYKTFFMLNSTEHEIFPAHKC